MNGLVAQWVECFTSNARGLGSIPTEEMFFSPTFFNFFKLHVFRSLYHFALFCCVEGLHIHIKLIDACICVIAFQFL